MASSIIPSMSRRLQGSRSRMVIVVASSFFEENSSEASNNKAISSGDNPMSLQYRKT
jgi:hypothetical protein